MKKPTIKYEIFLLAHHHVKDTGLFTSIYLFLLIFFMNIVFFPNKWERNDWNQILALAKNKHAIIEVESSFFITNHDN